LEKVLTPPATHNGDLRNLPAALAPMVAENRWVVWRWHYETARDAWTKVPFQADRPHLKASTLKALTWSSHDVACTAVENKLADGIGFVLTGSKFAAQDIDDCRNPYTREIDYQALLHIERSGSYVEITVSGTGLRIIGYGRGEHVHRKQMFPDSAVSIESYRGATRYIVVTGNQLGSASELLPIDGIIDETVAKLDEKPKEVPPTALVKAPAVRSNGALSLPNDLESLIRHGAALGERSDQFHHAVGWLKDIGKSADEIEHILSCYPEGIAAKYNGRLRKEIDRCYSKAADPLPPSWPRLVADEQSEPGEDEPETEVSVPGWRGQALDLSQMDAFRFDGDVYAPESLGGLLGLIARHLIDTALYPVPDFATMAAVVFGTALYGRRWSEPLIGGGLNLYVIATAPSGWGKDHPIQEMPRLAAKCGLSRLLGPNEFASDAAIEAVLRVGPVRACFIDEIGIVLQSNNNRNAGSWEKRIRKSILSLYSASKGVWSGRQSAGDDIDKGKEPVHRPTLSFYGTSTPDELYKGLTEDNIKDGLFGRLIFASPDNRPKRGTSIKRSLDEIRDGIEAVLSFVPPHIEERFGALYRSNMMSALMEPDVVQVPASAEALDSIEMILEWQRDITEREDGLSKIANRAGENVGKLATLRALSRDHRNPCVVLDDVRWGWSIVNRSLEVISRDIERHMAGSEFEVLVKTLRRYLEEAGKDGITYSHLIRKHGISRVHARDVIAALNMMRDAGEITMPKNKRGFRVTLVR
jgi:hypothetical protein